MVTKDKTKHPQVQVNQLTVRSLTRAKANLSKGGEFMQHLQCPVHNKQLLDWTHRSLARAKAISSKGDEFLQHLQCPVHDKQLLDMGRIVQCDPQLRKNSINRPRPQATVLLLTNKDFEAVIKYMIRNVK